jgi:hypothetical protein
VKLNRDGEVKRSACLQSSSSSSLHSLVTLLSLLTERPPWSSGDGIAVAGFSFRLLTF